MSSQICAVGAGKVALGTLHADVYSEYAPTDTNTDAAEPSAMAKNCARGQMPSRCAVLKSCATPVTHACAQRAKAGGPDVRPL
jgi:hypothetical protein